uniref:DUF569 domain-containing protein n=1 Tax=Triticum urartu TaxID=4572 RepID=A0A8R7TED9_TRIUA
MDQFLDGHHVRLRSRVHGTYLHADGDGHGVSLHGRRSSMKAAWAVHIYQGGAADAQYVLLHSAAYGSYLAATDAPAPRGHRGLRVEQRNYDEGAEEAIRWEAVRFGSGDDVLLRHVTGRCLRANGPGRYLPWNNGVSVDDIDNARTRMLWVVEHISAREGMPPLPRPTGVSPPSPCPLLDSSRLLSAEPYLSELGSWLALVCVRIQSRMVIDRVDFNS